jgi:hypothetical protein
MDAPPSIPPPVPAPNRAIKYSLTRWDLVVHSMTVIFRNRFLRVFVPIMLLVCLRLHLSVYGSFHSPAELILAGLIYCAGFVVVLAVMQGIMALVTAFLGRQEGIVGEHVLEITEAGLIERTEFNESLHKWPSICRIVSGSEYLYVYISELNSYAVPKRNLPPQQIRDFEADLRARALRAKR